MITYYQTRCIKWGNGFRRIVEWVNAPDLDHAMRGAFHWGTTTYLHIDNREG